VHPILGKDAAVKKEDGDFGESLDGYVEKLVDPKKLDLSVCCIKEEEQEEYLVEHLAIERVEIPNMQAKSYVRSCSRCQFPSTHELRKNNLPHIVTA
jgi:hypothetical protein